VEVCACVGQACWLTFSALRPRLTIGAVSRLREVITLPPLLTSSTAGRSLGPTQLGSSPRMFSTPSPSDSVVDISPPPLPPASCKAGLSSSPNSASRLQTWSAFDAAETSVTPSTTCAQPPPPPASCSACTRKGPFASKAFFEPTKLPGSFASNWPAPCPWPPRQAHGRQASTRDSAAAPSSDCPGLKCSNLSLCLSTREDVTSKSADLFNVVRVNGLGSELSLIMSVPKQ